MRKIIRRSVFPLTVIVFYYISIVLALGILIGSFSTYILSYTLTSKKKVELNLWKWKLHFHHWLMGLVALGIIALMNLQGWLDPLFSGIAGGMMAHDLLYDKNWYKIIRRKPVRTGA